MGTQYRGNWGYTRSKRVELLNKLEAAGVEWLRIGIPWSAVQPRKPTASDPGYSMRAVRRIEGILAEARARDFRILVAFGSTPGWANGGRGRTVPPKNVGDYARAARWMAARFRGTVQSWQVYNEPNLPAKFNASPPRYVRLLCSAYRAYHRAVPNIQVVMGGTAGNDWEWVQRAYAAGAKGCFDVLATHPYQAGSRSPYYPARSDHRWWFQNIRLVRHVMLDNRDGATPVWFTEIGWSTHRGVVRKPGVTLRQQADYLEQLLDITRDRYPFVEQLSWYMARNETSSDVHHNNFGLYYLDLDPKPAARRLRHLLVS